jgi:phosphomevalonate kinase
MIIPDWESKSVLRVCVQVMTLKKTVLKPVIGISGKQYAGKDAVADILLEGLTAQGLDGFVKIPLALAIKQAYGEQQGLSLAEIEAHKSTHRPGLIALGNWGRAQHPDYWIEQVWQRFYAGEARGLIISDVRLKREFEALREKNAFLISVEAERAVREARAKAANHQQLVSEDDPTECDLDAVMGWDLVVHNNDSLGALHATLSFVLEQTHCFGLK